MGRVAGVARGAAAAIVALALELARRRRRRRRATTTTTTTTEKMTKEADELGAFVEAAEDLSETLTTTTTTTTTTYRPLKNVKFVVKDLFDIEGRRCGFGSPAFKRTGGKGGTAAAKRHARCVRALLEAGASAVGMTTMDELAYAINGENAHYGTPINPRARALVPGGSSSGSAVACAAALRGCDFALGTDTGGSVRVPASYCGVYGIRTSHGSVSMHGVQALAPSFDTVGWFARSIDVLQRVGDVLLPEPDKHAPTEPSRWLLLEDAVSAKRSTPHSQCAAVAAVMALHEIAPADFKRMNLTEHLLVGCPKFRSLVNGREDYGLDCLREMVRVLMGAEIWENLGTWYTEEKPKLGAAVKARMEAASKLDADEVERLKEVREEVREEVDRILDGGAIFILPTTPGKAPKRGQSDQATESWRRKCFELLCIASLCGLPQVSIPLEAPNIEGPQGLSLIAGYQMDKMLIGAARQIVPALVEAYPDILEAELERLNPPEAPGESEKTKGNEALKQGKYQDAIEYYSVAIGKNPKSKIFVANRAMAHLKLGNYQLAEDDCTQAIKLDARYVKAYLRRAAARSVAGNYLEALMDYEEALRFEPNNSDAKREVYRMKKIIGMADPGMDVGDM